MNLLDKQIVLVLNRSWIPISVRTVRQAFVSLCSESNGEHPVMAIDMEVKTDEQGESTLVYANPVPWEVWVQMPVREGDLYIQSARQKIRVPTVVVASNFNKLVTKKPRLGKSAIARRDNMTCGYTGKKLTHATFSLDHIQPRSRGGRDEWTNLISCDKKVNQDKGDKTPEEAGLKLLFKPTTPPSTPVIIRPEDISHDSWKHFLVQ